MRRSRLQSQVFRFLSVWPLATSPTFLSISSLPERETHRAFLFIPVAVSFMKIPTQPVKTDILQDPEFKIRFTLLISRFIILSYVCFKGSNRSWWWAMAEACRCLFLYFPRNSEKDLIKVWHLPLAVTCGLDNKTCVVELLQNEEG